jgi:hypothetical protein
MPPSIIITEKHAVPAASSLTAAPNRIFGLDIGGTKCALSVLRDGRVEEIVRVETGDFTTTFNLLTDALGAYVADTSPIFGISCGGPLDASAGIVLSPRKLARRRDHAVANPTIRWPSILDERRERLRPR